MPAPRSTARAAPMSYAASIAGRFARDALALGEGEVCAAFRRSFYLRFPGERYACVGDASLGRGPLNALVDDFRPAAVGGKVSVAVTSVWQAPRLPPTALVFPREMKVPE